MNTANPQLGNLQTYNPTANFQKNVNLQGRNTAYNFGDLFSSNLDPIVSGQMSQGLQDSANASNQRNQNIAQSFGMGNDALVRSLQTENNINTGLNEGATRLAALTQQRDYDITKRGAEERSAQIDMQRMEQLNNANLASGNFTNNAMLQQQQAELDAVNFNNQTELSKYNAGLQGNLQQQELLKILGQGLISTAPQGQMNFTVDDLEKLKNNPDLLDPYIYGGGLLSQGEMNMFNGQQTAPQNLVKYSQAPQNSRNGVWQEPGKGWTNGNGQYHAYRMGALGRA